MSTTVANVHGRTTHYGLILRDKRSHDYDYLSSTIEGNLEEAREYARSNMLNGCWMNKRVVEIVPLTPGDVLETIENPRDQQARLAAEQEAKFYAAAAALPVSAEPEDECLEDVAIIPTEEDLDAMREEAEAPDHGESCMSDYDRNPGFRSW